MRDKFSILANYLYFKYRLNFYNRNSLETWQNKQIAKFKSEVLNKSVFYQQNQSITIDKQIMMDNFDAINIVGVKKSQAFDLAIKAEQDRNFVPTINNITVGLSSGTSGNRGLFLASTGERNKWAAQMLYKALPKSIFNAHKIAFFLRANSNLYTTLSQTGRLQFNYFDLTIPLSLHIEALNIYQPSILVAPAQVLKMLAHAQELDKLKIAPIKIISVAELLTSEDQEYIGKIFNQIVHQIYQATEGFLGISCKYGTIHLNEEFIYFEKEWLDKDKTRFMPIIYDFTRRSQPIWRYRLNDILLLKNTPCECGSPNLAIEMIEGRCDDIFYAKNQEKKLVAIFPDFIRKHIMLSSEKIRDYRAIQLSCDHIDLTVAVEYSDQIESNLRKEFNNLLNELHIEQTNFTIRICFVNGFEQLPINKLRRIERKYRID